MVSDIARRQPLRYASYCYDAESGLYYLSSRSYDPFTRQFLSKDLSRNDGEESAYQYCGGNPVAGVDPTGYRTVIDGLVESGNKTAEQIFREQERASANTTKASGLSSVTKAQVTIAAGSAVIVGGVAYLVIGPERFSALVGGMGATAAGVSYTAKMAAPTVAKIGNQLKHVPHVIRDLLHGSASGGSGGGGGASLVKYDPQYASRTILGQNHPGATGWGVTPAGRTVSVHAAERIVQGGPGRPPTSLGYVDMVLDSGTMVHYDPIRNTIQDVALRRSCQGAPSSSCPAIFPIIL